MARLPSELRAELSTYIAGQTPGATYRQVATDVWSASPQPLTPDSAPEDAFQRHLLFDVSIGDVVYSSGGPGTTSNVQVDIDVWALCMIRPGHEVEDRASAHDAALDLWRYLVGANPTDADVTLDTSSPVCDITQVTERAWLAHAHAAYLLCIED